MQGVGESSGKDMEENGMAMIFMGTGDAHLGVVKKDAMGNVISRTQPHWEAAPGGGCVALGMLDPETMTPEADGVEFFGDWDAARYLTRALALLNPSRRINVPDLAAMIRLAAKQGMDICEYCPDCNCRDCIVDEWKGGACGG